MEKPILNIGIDVGSTTVKVVVINDKEEILFSTYQRHMSEVRQKIISILQEVQNKFPNYSFRLALTGSGALTLYTKLNLNFVQEVIASGLSINC